MKKIIFFIVLSSSLSIFQSCDNDKKDKDEEIAINNVPALVQSAFTAKYSTATDTKWEDAHEDGKQTYKAKFTLNGKKMKAEYDANGGLIKESEDN